MGSTSTKACWTLKITWRFLDSFGDAAFQQKKGEVARSATSIWRESSSRFSALRKENAQRNERQEYLQSRVKELDAAQLDGGGIGQTCPPNGSAICGAEKIDSALHTAYEQVYYGGREESAVVKLRQAAEAMNADRVIWTQGL